jgi:hypothetical protein
MAITNDLPSVFCWVSQMASSHISSYISVGGFIAEVEGRYGPFDFAALRYAQDERLL